MSSPFNAVQTLSNARKRLEGDWNTDHKTVTVITLVTEPRNELGTLGELGTFRSRLRRCLSELVGLKIQELKASEG